MFLLLIKSSIVRLRGTIKLVRPLCKHPNKFRSICNTSSEELY